MRPVKFQSPRDDTSWLPLSLDASAWGRIKNIFDQNPDAVLADIKMQQQVGTVLVGVLNLDL